MSLQCCLDRIFLMCHKKGFDISIPLNPNSLPPSSVLSFFLSSSSTTALSSGVPTFFLSTSKQCYRYTQNCHHAQYPFFLHIVYYPFTSISNTFYSTLFNPKVNLILLFSPLFVTIKIADHSRFEHLAGQYGMKYNTDSKEKIMNENESLTVTLTLENNEELECAVLNIF